MENKIRIEKALFSKILVMGGFDKTVDILKPKYFSSKVMRDTYFELSDTFKNGGIVDNSLIIGLLGKTMSNEEIADLTDIIEGGSAEKIANDIRGNHFKAERLKTLVKLEEAISNNADETDIKELQEKLLSINDELKGKKIVGTKGRDVLDRMMKKIAEGDFKKPTKTGFNDLDKGLNGGLYPGLHVVGAISSLGKTTMVQNICDNIADDKPVLFFSLEMSDEEIMTKTLSKLTFEFGGAKLATSALDISRYNFDTDNHRKTFDKATHEYTREIANNFNIIEGEPGTTVESINDEISSFIRINQEKPVVVIDYLQILDTSKDCRSDREKIDYIVKYLKIMSRKLDTPVIVISSFNRASYMSSVSFESFKESGGIEYTADTVLGLELEVIRNLPTGDKAKNERINMINEAKAAVPRKLRLICLKNRNGATYFETNFVYQSKFNLFKEC